MDSNNNNKLPPPLPKDSSSLPSSGHSCPLPPLLPLPVSSALPGYTDFSLVNSSSSLLQEPAAGGDEVVELKKELAALKAKYQIMVSAVQQAEMTLQQTLQTIRLVLPNNASGMVASAGAFQAQSMVSASAIYHPDLSFGGPVDLSSGHLSSVQPGLSDVGPVDWQPDPLSDLPWAGPLNDLDEQKTNPIRFEERLVQLKRFKDGELTPEDGEEYKSFRDWRTRMDRENKNGTLSDTLRKKLVAGGFTFSTEAIRKFKTFEQRLVDLKAYHDEHGHFDVSQRSGTKEEKSLGSWVYDLRRSRGSDPSSKRRGLNSERIAALDAIGFTWTAVRKRKAEEKACL